MKSLILVRNSSSGRNWFLHKDRKSSTTSINDAKVYKTINGANKRCEGTTWLYDSKELYE